MTELPSPSAATVAAILNINPEPGIHVAYVQGVDELVVIAHQTVADLGEDHAREWLMRMFSRDAHTDGGRTAGLLATALVRLASLEGA